MPNFLLLVSPGPRENEQRMEKRGSMFSDGLGCPISLLPFKMSI